MAGSAMKCWARIFTVSPDRFSGSTRGDRSDLTRTQGLARKSPPEKRDGEIVVACRKIMNHEGDAVLEVSRDITAQLQAEEALRETEKLAAMGRVAGIIAHEINNPLAAITNIFYLIRNHPSLDEDARHCAAMAEQELQRVSHITPADSEFLS